jgi:Zn-dependent protease
MLNELFANPAGFLALITVLVVSLTVHEYAHAWSALQLGDPTAYAQGRLTLNPLRHLDPMGSLLMLVVGFGWAKPVPIDGYRLGRTGTMWVSLAGPVSNIVMATIALVPLRLPLPLPAPLQQFAYYFGLLNIVLALFNLLPLHPLDGWKVLLGIVPPATAWRLQEFERYGVLILFALLFLGPYLPFDPISAYLFAGSRWIAGLLTGS